MNNPNEEPLEYNRKWEGYLAILLSSLVNFASVADVSVAGFQIKLQNEKILAVFGAVTFILSLFVFIFDRVKFLHRRFDFKEVWDGRLEGYVLLFFVLWWIVGVGIMTKADGIAYRVLNTYFSSWYSLFMCIYTLNKWTSAKDIISIKELTQLSKTLPYWYCLLLSSLVEMGSATDVLVTLKRREYSPSKAYYAVIVGAVSAPIALLAILIHYKIICSKIKPGGMTEIILALLLCVWWIVAVSLLTADGSVASTIQGSQVCDNTDAEYVFLGNNLYLSLWAGLYSAVQLCLKWKATQAMVMSNVTKSQQNASDVDQEELVEDANDDEDF